TAVLVCHRRLGKDALGFVDISDPSDLREIGSFDVPAISGLVVEGDLVYTVNRGLNCEYLLIIDISDISNPFEAGRYSNGHRISISYAHESIAYVRDYNLNALLYLDITDPSNIEELGEISLDIADVDVVADLAYVGTWRSGLKIYNFSDPLNPVLVSQFGSGNVLDVDVLGDIAFIAKQANGLEILNISDPLNTVSIGQYSDLWVVNLCVQNKIQDSSVHIYAAIPALGVEIIEVKVDIDLDDQGTTTSTKSSTVDTAVISGFGIYLTISVLVFLLAIKWRKRQKNT
ncbi:MAG: LVIVD repeat-containing protein, partial [Candidatus Odinarchaeota archaeon]